MVPRTVPWNIDIWNLIFFCSATFVFDRLLTIILNFNHLLNNVKSKNIMIQCIKWHQFTLKHYSLIKIWNYCILKYNYPKPVCIDKVFEFFRIYQQLERLMWRNLNKKVCTVDQIEIMTKLRILYQEKIS